MEGHKTMRSFLLCVLAFSLFGCVDPAGPSCRTMVDTTYNAHTLGVDTLVVETQTCMDRVLIP
jgi:hypothetical protein